MMLRYGGVAYKDADITLREWPKLKKAQKFPFNGLPVLDVETDSGVLTIGQSGAINRYIAKDLGLYPEDRAAAALCDSIFEASQDLALINKVVNLPR
jgi:glutathione S-transferase